MKINRGDIVNVFIKENESNKTQLALIISGNDENSILDTVILLPLSNDLIDDMYPYRLRIKSRDNIDQDLDVLINQIRTIKKVKIKEKVSEVTLDEYNQIIENLYKNF